MKQDQNRFTTYEAIRFIELSMSQEHATAQSFINAVCDTKTSKQDSGLIKDNKELHRAKGLKNKLDDALQKLDREDFIKNVRQNLRSEEAIEYLNYELRERIDLAENIEETSEHVNDPDVITKEELLKITDYSWFLMHVLYCTLINQSDDRDAYSSIYGKDPKTGYTREPDSDYYSKLEAKLNSFENDANSLASSSTPKEDFTFLHSLEILSDSIYEDILNKANRYHATSIESMLLTLGSDSALPTYGSSKDTLNEMSYYFGLEDNLFIVGEGGIGKTTAAIDALNKHHEQKKTQSQTDIPIFITLNKLKNNTMAPSGSYILSEIIRKIKDLIKNKKLNLQFDPYKIESMIEQAFDLESS
ncbi:MAG: hypothetical protein IKN47_00745, partial [Lachnospiraceae bacterium]|nr:hypothetical protein [Lachnospiraceae bacterium]